MIDLSRRLYRTLAGKDAYLAHVPLAALRAIRGNFATVTVGGKRLTVDLRDDVMGFHLAFRRIWEPNETAFVSRTLRPGDCVVDVGANLGYYATLFGGLVGPEGRVLAIEANPANADLCARNLAQNHLDGVVTLERAAAGPEGSSALLYMSRNNFGAHTMVKPDGDAEAVRVEVIPIDALVADWPRLDFIKIDVEGYEPFVFAGARAALARFPDVAIMCEFDPSYIARAGRDPFAFLEELAGQGFGFSTIGPGGRDDATSIPALRARLEGTHDAVNLLLRRAATRG